MIRMIIVCGLLFIVTPVMANENKLEMFAPNFLCKKDESNKRKPYSYYAGFYIKNIDSKEITIVSKISGRSLSQRADGKYGLNFTLNPVTAINKIPLIPSIVDFALVTLRPGEATYIDKKFNSKKLLSKVDFHYSIADNYDQRFGYWTGRVHFYDVDLKNPKHCKS